MEAIKRKRNSSPITIQKFMSNLRKRSSSNTHEVLIQEKESECSYRIDNKKRKLTDSKKEEILNDTSLVTTKTNTDTGKYKCLLNLIQSLKEDYTSNTRLKPKNESTNEIPNSMKNVYESNIHNQTIKNYFHVAKHTSSSQQKVREDNLKPIFSNKHNIKNYSLHKKSMINTNSISISKKTTNANTFFENINVASKRTSPYKSNGISNSPIENHDHNSNCIIAFGNKIQQLNSETSEKDSSKIEDYIGKLNVQKNMKTSVSSISKRNSFNKLLKELDQKYTLHKTENFVDKQKDTSIIEKPVKKDRGRKISFDEFTNRVLQVIEGNTRSESQNMNTANKFSNNELPRLNNVLDKLKANNKKCNKVISIPGNLSTECEENAVVNEFSCHDCTDEAADLRIISSKMENSGSTNKSLNEIVTMLKINKENCSKKLSEPSMADRPHKNAIKIMNLSAKPSRKNNTVIKSMSVEECIKIPKTNFEKSISSDFEKIEEMSVPLVEQACSRGLTYGILNAPENQAAAVYAKHSLCVAKENAESIQFEASKSMNINEIVNKLKTNSGKWDTSKLQGFDISQPITSESFKAHINLPQSKTKENTKEDSISVQRLLDRHTHFDHDNSIPTNTDMEEEKSTNIDFICSNNMYLSDILKGNNSLEADGILNGTFTDKAKVIHTSQVVTASTNEKYTLNTEVSYVFEDNIPTYSSENPESVQRSNLLSSQDSGCKYIFQADNVNPSNCSKPSALLDDELLKSILTKNYESHKRKTPKEQGSLKDVFAKLTQNTQVDTDESISNKCHIKRFRKGNVRIYRLKKLKKITSSKDTPLEKNLNFDELFEKITQGFVEPKYKLPKSESFCSVSTSSSYVSDDARSETLSTGSNNLNSPDVRLRKGINELSKDNNLLYCDSQYRDTTNYSRDEIRMKIQDVFLQVFDDLTNGRSSSLTYRRQCYDNCELKNDRLQFKPNELVAMSVISSSSKRSEAKFKLIMYIMRKIQTLLETNTKLTKRELYYQFKNITKDQSVTDRAINSISCLLDVGMWSLNIQAQKGLVFGNLKILMSSGETLNCNIPGTLIPQDIAEICEIQSTAFFILVVEKEATFHKLIEEDLPNKLTRPFIMITGKGFPDLNTQLFLRKLWVIMSIPVFILVDADPHGVNIMLNYRFGSVANAHVSHHLAVPRAKWLGVYPSEIVNFNITRQPMNERELKLVDNLLKTPYMDQHPGIVQELKVLQERKYKASIEGLIRSDIYLSQVYLPTKFFSHHFI